MADSDNRVGFWPVALVWGLAVAGYTARAISNTATIPLLLDTDDAMRLTEVRDFLHGQNWFDLVQHRLNTPYGAEMHWSRIIDLPEATILFLLRPFLGTFAETVTAYVWPLLLLGPLLWLTAKSAIRLGGRLALWPALLLTPFGIISLTEFVPGRLDHHSAQLLCTLLMLLCAIAALDRPRFALGAGIAAGVALGIGIEGLPLAGVTVTVFALMWVADTRHAAALRDFGLSFGLATALALAQGVPPWRWLELRLDAISAVYAGAALLCAAAFLVLSLLPLRIWPGRLAAAVVAALAVIGILLAIDPAILKGPYAALDPWLVQNWLSHIAEAESWLQSFHDDPVYPLAVTIPVLIGLLTAIWNAVRRRADRGAWLVAIAFLVMGLAVMLIQIRAARLVTPLAVPACAALIAALWRHFRETKRLLPALGIFVASLASAGLVTVAIVTLAEPADPTNVPLGNAPGNGASVSRNPCLLPSAFTDLAGLPPERIMAPIDLGSHILAYTPHAVVGAPYHRNQQGLLDTFHFFNEPIDQARGILDARGISLVVICPSLREIQGIVDHTPDSFISLFAANRLPAWLVDQSLPGATLKIYSVSRR